MNREQIEQFITEFNKVYPAASDIEQAFREESIRDVFKTILWNGQSEK